ncbi:NADH-quinone oxidoreductase subunit NuoE family protein [Syntrophaceticus schinkii]|uniref:NADH dehydrogenase (Ubiquinone) 24 kDa subunit n=1 Tax=Syntrophaceticus schinkii TaxID=499207 RepID=A0A0B7MES0_9FIRM|nr:NAD(P)H-dependent oxidoreductase subunit E [Syntrophaceticus schinkii]MDD2359282.1 NAD(P)H-dependent oxidoreductase subunit E [Syntrophaceticus schinkii]MDD4261162.1 NAD(P)H-dependent oxidoreductase subunit E [Syntrophaceticus schinkii]CEO88570.1 NADH dehydrogenase (Ubiquinone) 24 kDa subunit [Syntrophaceticus schinkii]
MSNYEEILDEHKGLPGGIIQAYHAIQKKIRFLPEEAILTAAKVFAIPTKDAYEVATFYSYFATKQRGQNVIRICESAPCHVAGVNEIVAALEQELGIKMGETTPDGKFTLEFTQCVGQCQGTPVVTINRKPYVDVAPENIPAILAGY